MYILEPLFLKKFKRKNWSGETGFERLTKRLKKLLKLSKQDN